MDKYLYTDKYIHIVKEETQTYNVNGENIPVLEWEIECELPMEALLPLIQRAEEHTYPNGWRPGTRRVGLMSFQIDGETASRSLNEILTDVVTHTREVGAENIGPEHIREYEQYIHLKMCLAGQHWYCIQCVPGFDKAEFLFMVPAVTVRLGTNNTESAT